MNCFLVCERACVEKCNHDVRCQTLNYVITRCKYELNNRAKEVMQTSVADPDLELRGALSAIFPSVISSSFFYPK